MKIRTSWLPHLCYLSLLLGGGIYFWQKQTYQTQLSDLLHAATAKTYQALQRSNAQFKKETKRQVMTCQDRNNLRAFQGMQRADSLVKIALANPYALDSLRDSLMTLAQADTAVTKRLNELLPPQSNSALPAGTDAILTTNDSIRRQLALTRLFNYYVSKMQFECFSTRYSPILSTTTLCVPPGEPVEMDAFLSVDYDPWQKIQVRVNGQLLPSDDEGAYFEQTFTAPGIYPLKIEGQVLNENWPGKLVLTAEKTFFLHVNR